MPAPRAAGLRGKVDRLKTSALLFSLVLLLSVVTGCAVDKVTREQSEGIDHYVDGDLREFRAKVLSSFKEAPDNPYVMNNMGVLYELEGNLPAAREMYRKAIDNAGELEVTKSSNRTDEGKLLKDVAKENLERVEARWLKSAK